MPIIVESTRAGQETLQERWSTWFTLMSMVQHTYVNCFFMGWANSFLAIPALRVLLDMALKDYSMIVLPVTFSSMVLLLVFHFLYI